VRPKTIALAAVGVGSLLTGESHGQSTAKPPGVCFRGRPTTVCRAFWVTEAGYYQRLVATGVKEVLPPAQRTLAHLNSHASWEIGGMVNRGQSRAVGATVLVGFDDLGHRLGVKGRYRRWLGGHERTLDLSGGVLRAYSTDSYPDLPAAAYGVTGDVSLGWGDRIAVTAQADLLRGRSGRAVSALYGGVRLGSHLAIGATVIAVLVGVIVFATTPMP
jgi:hypothetical protein